MRTLVYKRTHPGDPDEHGVFGAEDCMGRVRKRNFEAVIGIGGLGRESRSHDLAAKLHWIGVGPNKLPGEPWMRAPRIVFDRYIDYGCSGPLLKDVAPKLARRMYSSRLRHMMDGFTPEEQKEIDQLLKRAVQRPKGSTRGPRSPAACRPKRRRKTC